MGREQTIPQLFTRHLWSWGRSRPQWQGSVERFGSEWGQLRMEHMLHLLPIPLRLPLWHWCRHHQVSGWNREDPSAANQKRHFIWPQAFPSTFEGLLTARRSMRATSQLNDDGFSMHKHSVLFQNVIWRWKKRIDYILENTFITTCMLICIYKYIHMYVCTQI